LSEGLASMVLTLGLRRYWRPLVGPFQDPARSTCRTWQRDRGIGEIVLHRPVRRARGVPGLAPGLLVMRSDEAGLLIAQPLPITPGERVRPEDQTSDVTRGSRARPEPQPGIVPPTMIAAAMPAHLPGVLHGLEPTLNHLGYLAVLGLVLIEDFGVPVPGETVLILAAVYAGAGRLNVVLVALLGFCGAVLGDNVGFAIGHFGGRPLIERYGRYVFLTPERIDSATGFFERHGGWIIVVARFIEGLRQANGIVAGISGINWAKFLVFNVIGAALWVALWTTIGYFSGTHIDTIYHDATRYSAYLAIALGLLLLAYIARRVLRARRARAPNVT
jgi:membrane protein DedA with SNARE-associated domain